MVDDRALDGDAPLPAAAALRDEIRRHRLALRLSQPRLAELVGYSRQYLSLVERETHNLPSLEVVTALDRAFGAGGALLALRERAKAEREGKRALPPGLGETIVETPAGQYFPGSATPALVVAARPASIGSRVWAPLDREFVRQPRRALVIGALAAELGGRQFALDVRGPRGRLHAMSPGAGLLIPYAYELDDFTRAILWAVSNLDDALLEDDAELDRLGVAMASMDEAPAAAGRELGCDLSGLSQLWFGSDFCVRHILHNVRRLTEAPALWARDQRGEEAVNWLLFRHVYEYLRWMCGLAGDATPHRAFCIPPAAVADSSRAERILLLLAIALTESFGTPVGVCVDPEYTVVQGFLLEGRRRAVVANWIRVDGLWQVGVTESAPDITDFTDASDYVRAHSVIGSPDPYGRLRAFADYLELDWAWLVRRCADMARFGVSGFVRPRSRLLSLDGLDRACRYLAVIDQGQLGSAGGK